MFLNQLSLTLFIVINLHLISNQKVSSLKIENRSPVILIPGDGGSQIEAKLNKVSTVNPFCTRTSNVYQSLWLNLLTFVPIARDCWVDNFKLTYDPVTRKTSNAQGVEVRVPGFGNTTSIEYLDPNVKLLTGYMNSFVEALVGVGYTRGVDLMGAPYDFRRAPNEMSDYYKNVEQLIETSYEKFGKKCFLICHSMGCPNMLYFLNKKTQEWKDKYVQSFITLAGPWGGSLIALKALTSGDNLGVVVLPNDLAFEAEQNHPSLYYLLPTDKFWPHDTVLASFNNMNITTANYKEFFTATDNSNGYEIWKDVRNLTYNLDAPGVEVHCLHGTGVDTVAYLDYRQSKNLKQEPQITKDDGDGTVNERSLKGCLRWTNQQSKQVYHGLFKNVNHMKMLSNSNVIQYVLNVLSKNY